MEHAVCLPTPQRAQVASFKFKWSILHICAIGTLVLSMALLTFCLVFHKANHLTVCGSKAKYETEEATWKWESKMCSQDWLQANNSTVEINRTGFYTIHIQVSYPGASQHHQGKRSQIELQVLCDGEKKNIKKREIYFSNDISPDEKKSVTLDVSALLMKGNKIHLNIHEKANIILKDESLTFWEINAIVGHEIWPSGHCTTEK